MFRGHSSEFEIFIKIHVYKFLAGYVTPNVFIRIIISRDDTEIERSKLPTANSDDISSLNGDAIFALYGFQKPAPLTRYIADRQFSDNLLEGHESVFRQTRIFTQTNNTSELCFCLHFHRFEVNECSRFYHRPIDFAPIMAIINSHE